MKAPFTKEQVKRIQAWQENQYTHSFTCGAEDCRMDLHVDKNGLYCGFCGYEQDWIHDIIANSILDIDAF